MTVLFHSSVWCCRRAAHLVFHACFGAEVDQQLWRWMLPREQDASRDEALQV